MRTMTKQQAIELLADCVQIGKYLQWESPAGREFAWMMMSKIHDGKYGDISGVWVQADAALKVLRESNEG
jgi:hypothetical protein